MSSFILKYFKLGLVAGFILAFGLSVTYFALNRAEGEELPPSLEYDEDFFKGLIRIEDEMYFKFSKREIDDSVGLSKFRNATLRSGRQIQYFYSDVEITVKDVLDSIVPQENNKFAIAYYEPNISNWYSYPKGPFKNTVEILERSILTHKIPAGRAFVIAGERNFQTVNIKHASERPSAMYFEIEDLSRGWTLYSIKNDNDFERLITSCENRVKAIWVQNANNNFEKTSKLSPRLKNGYFLAWFLIGNTGANCNPLTPSTGSNIPDTVVPVVEDPVVTEPERCANESPVCDDEGVFYQNICLANEADAETSRLFVPTNEGLCVSLSLIDTGAMPMICNPLILNPICDLDGSWFRNRCFLLQKTDFASTVYMPVEGEERCEIEVVSEAVEDPDISNAEVVDNTPVELSSDENSSASQVVDSSPEVDLSGLASPEDNTTISSVLPEEPIGDFQTCISNEPVCSDNGLYFDNICKLQEGGFTPDEREIYSTENRFLENGQWKCISLFRVRDENYTRTETDLSRFVDIPSKTEPGEVLAPRAESEYMCEETDLIAQMYSDDPENFDLVTAMYILELSTPNCIRPVVREMTTLNLKTDSAEYFSKIDEMLADKTSVCCTQK